MGYLRPSYKHLIVGCLMLGSLYLWISIHFSHRVHADVNSSAINQHVASKKESEEPTNNVVQECQLMAPFTDVIAKSTYCQLKDVKNCLEAQDLFFSAPPPSCSDDEAVKYCYVDNQKGKVLCNGNACKETFSVGIFDIRVGEMKYVQFDMRLKGSLNKLHAYFSNLCSERTHSGYVLISCSDTAEANQMLVLPMTRRFSKDQRVDQTKSVNLNVVFLDSLSFHHFHRSLPVTTKYLKELRNTDKNMVLTYPMFQSLKSRTFENLQALFSGEADTDKSFATLAMPYAKLKLEAILKPLKDKGYSTLFTEDLCWSWEWGISKDLLVHNKSLELAAYWRKLVKAFDLAGIEDYGISPSSCEIMEANGRPDPFHGMPAVCYNGRHQHEYHLDYLANYHKAHIHSGKPYISFYMSNTPHDDWGRRIQTLDKHLVDYLHNVVQSENTITILLSDHGNAYGEFANTPQGRLERYHPFLYMLVPAKARNLLGASISNSLLQNQGRLVTMMDLHYLLKYIAVGGPREGIIGEISADRTCADLPLYDPNICLCDGSDRDDHLSAAVLKLSAEFAAGYVSNHLIEDGGGISKAHCRFLIPNSYSNAQITKYKVGQYKITMDVNFNSTINGAKMETLLVSVRYSPSNSPFNGMQLLSVERSTKYSIYRTCNDGAKTEQFCICENNKRYHLNNGTNFLMFNGKSDLISKTESQQLAGCVYAKYRIIKDSTAFTMYLVSICNGMYNVAITLNVPDEFVLHSTLPPDGVQLQPYDVQFVMVLQYLKSNLPLLSSFFKFTVNDLNHSS